MKWLMLLLVFIGGIFYLFNQKKQEELAKEKARQQQAEQIKTSEPELPQTTEKSTALKLGQQTLETMRTLTSDTNEKVRLAAVELLWQMQDDQVDEIVKNMFETETDAETKQQLIEILARTKSVKSLNLIAVALKDTDKDVKIKAVDALGTFGTKEAIPALNAALKDYDEEVRLKALKAVDNVRRDIENTKQEQLQRLQEQAAKKGNEPQVKVQ